VIKKQGLFNFCACICLLACAGTIFAVAEVPDAEGFLNNNSVASLQSTSATNGISVKKTFLPTNFSISEGALDRLDNIGLERLLVEGDQALVAKPTSAKKKVGKIMAIVGLGAAGAGTIMALAGGDPSTIGDSGLGVNWRATGIAWIGVGLAVAIVGFIMLGSK
jgi:hypothetical protein